MKIIFVLIFIGIINYFYDSYQNSCSSFKLEKEVVNTYCLTNQMKNFVWEIKSIYIQLLVPWTTLYIYKDLLFRLYKHVKQDGGKYVQIHNKIIHAFQHLQEKLSKEQQQIEHLDVFV